MNVIFLDVDGVLNCVETTAICNGLIGIDNTKVKRLKEIVNKTKSKIVLTSTWKMGWSNNYDKCDYDAKYLNDKLQKQDLIIYDKTIDKGSNRGEGIYDWIMSHEVENWIVLDDEIFKDYDEVIKDHLIHTNFYDRKGGLQNKHINQAIKILKRNFKGDD